ncbi:proteasome assembly chaperone 4-like [Octopus bimaculoides]|nr:proteasome assembly chaperone 4-like [Octopus bimaculoides]
MPGMNVDPSENCFIKIHRFSDKITDTTVHFQVIQMANSFHMWFGSSPRLSNMAVAMQTKYDTSMPNGCQLMTDSADSLSIPLAQKLAKKTGKQVFLSSDLSSDHKMVPLIEQRIFEEMKLYPEKF